MRGRGWHRFCLVALAAGLCVGTAPPAGAASFTLSARDREEAVRTGRKSVFVEGYGAEWRVEGTGGQTLLVMTPFHRLALAARNAAFRNQVLRPREIDALAREYEGRLVVWATLRGPRLEFARHYVPVLLGRQREIKPAFAQNEWTARRDEDGGFTARCRYVFPAEELDPRGTVLLVIRDAEERQVARFTVDLSAMR